MLKFKFQFLLPVAIFLISGILYGCDDDSNTIFDPDKEMDPDPEIQQVVPENEAFAGVGSVTLEGIEPVVIYGENFGNDKDRVDVYFGESQAEVLELHEDRVIVTPPDDPGEERKIRVSVIGAEKYSEVDYELVPIFETFPGLEDADEPRGMTTDPDGVLYAANIVSDAFDGVDRFFRDGSSEKIIEPENWSYLRLRHGPDDAIYLLRGGTIPIVYRAEEGQDSPDVISGPAHGLALQDLDFDSNENLWTGGLNHGDDDQDILRIDIYGDPNDPEHFRFEGDIHAIRAYQGDLYVSAQRYEDDDANDPNQSGVWRLPIDGNDELGDEELFVEMPDPEEYIRKITFTEAGQLVAATTTAESIYIHRDQELEPLYPGVIPPGAFNFAVSSKDKEQLIVGIQGTTIDGRTSEDKMIILEMNQEMAPFYGSR
ncbi:IPT/TIG domain-containing protein [Natronogracilivirga saccharolytica]|uniref:IPT/TIG domain-containing protein n=1 Tax=Natronogracilivirga saccharolytica TaxID=2812953 RepID=A0A8J7RNN1_9BACT|nr:IPT/TIG domain-containing protein [Natronogracilivirga saccharolytica]MBP3193069.1 IPT/TIG domain-containing protein [Natronogracilivirga saccharolytica]